eukprot:g203.t1
MREVFSNNSRCFMSTLHADAPADGGGVYTAPNEFTAARPVCYEVECASDGASYTLKVTNLLTDPISVMSIGTCAPVISKLLEFRARVDDASAFASLAAVAHMNPHSLDVTALLLNLVLLGLLVVLAVMLASEIKGLREALRAPMKSWICKQV